MVNISRIASLSQVQRAQILTLHIEGYSEHEIGVKLNFNKISGILQIMELLATCVEMGVQGRRVSRDDCTMMCMATRCPSSLCMKICAALLAKGTNVSPVTVSRHLRDETGLKSHKPACRPCLTRLTDATFKSGNISRG